MACLYLVSNLKAPLQSSEEDLRGLVAEKVCRPASKIQSLQIVKQSVDARRKPDLYYVYHLEITTAEPLPEPLPPEIKTLDHSSLDIATPAFLEWETGNISGDRGGEPVVVVGSGPAGLFAALALGEAGVKTIMLERGKPVETRMRDIGRLRSSGLLDSESNVCFGEGGAGAYTDGKLYTRVKNPLVRWVMRRLVDFGAPEDILIKTHPHLGTDKLVRLVKRFRQHLQELGVDIHFQTKVQRLLIEDGRLRGVLLANGDTIATSRVILAIGHSARETLTRLWQDGVHMEAKPFAVGVRAEHPQTLINAAQFGEPARHPLLGAASYHLTHQIPDDYLNRRGVYTFCMCPGGFIVPSPTEPEHMAVNGMSNANRSTAFANSGVVVQVTPDDLLRRGYPDHPLVGIDFQRDLESRVFKATSQAYAAPAMRVDAFVAGKPQGSLAPSNFRPKAEPADLIGILPGWITQPLRASIKHFDRKIRGYLTAEANLLAVESRTSAPLRIPRGDDMMSVNTAGLYPVGEGAGYAGGIVSAAVDGIRAVEAMLHISFSGKP